MKLRTVSGMMLTLLLVGMLILTFDIQPVKSDYTWTETIYIRADGSVDPEAAPISSADNVTYTLTDNIVGDVPQDASAIVVQRDNIVLDGAGYTLQGTGVWESIGINLTRRRNVTINNMKIKNFFEGILVEGSSNNSICGNQVINNVAGVDLMFESSNNTISGNNATANSFFGIGLWDCCNYNTISGNNITNNGFTGIYLSFSSNNTICGNNIIDHDNGGITVASQYPYGVNNLIYHNNFENNTPQVGFIGDCLNFWDDSYPSGGNYWSDYTDQDFYRGPNQNEDGSDGIWDKPYIMNSNNTDRYPLTKPYGGPHDIGITNITTSKTIVCQGYNLGITAKTLNYGIEPETFTITAYVNATEINTEEVTLTSRNSTTITFTWNTTGIAKGDYILSVKASVVPGETDTVDNNYNFGTISINMVGDLNSDGKVTITDIVIIALAFGAKPGDSNWNPNADINNDGRITITDIVIAALHFGETDP